MAQKQTPHISLRPITPEHASVLTSLARDTRYSRILGSGFEENKRIAEAFSRSYPQASLIINSDNQEIGIVVVEQAGEGYLETTVITDDKNVFADVLIRTVAKYKGKYKGMYITPEFPEELVRVSIETRTKIAREKDFLDGTKSKEFKISL